jgi:hypothetical protein
VELVVILFIALAIAGVAFGFWQNRKRRQELELIAQRHGWQLNSGKDSSFDDRYGEFSCLKRGSNRYANNILTGSSAGRAFCGFDYHYETHSTDSEGKTQTHHHSFSAVMVETGLPLEPLSIRSESFFDKIGGLFGFDDIDFESDEFSRTFHVKAPNRRWAYDVLHQETMEYLLHAPRFAIEFSGPRVLAQRDSLFKPTDFETALDVIAGIVDRLPKSVLREMKASER